MRAIIFCGDGFNYGFWVNPLPIYVISIGKCVKEKFSVQKQNFLDEVEVRLTRLFSASRDGYKLPDEERHRLEGFMQAGIFIQLVTRAEMSQLMDSVHVTIFGKTMSVRKAENTASWPDTVIDYSAYEQPVFERNR